MKIFIAIVMLVGLVAAADEDSCFNNVESSCSTLSGATPEIGKQNCNSQFGAINHIGPYLQNYVNDHLKASYDYLILSTFFNSYQKDRPGFAKLFRGLSDAAFDSSLKLIKHISRRGAVKDFEFYSREKVVPLTKSLDLDELQAIAKVLDVEKKLTNHAIKIHGHASQHNTKTYDPEITQFIEEEFLEKQAETVRKLSGYANDLHKIMDADTKSASLGVHLFDEYLKSQ